MKNIKKFENFLNNSVEDLNLELRSAAKTGDIDRMKLLVKNGAAIDFRRHIVLKSAVEWGQVGAVKWILSKVCLTPEILANAIHWIEISNKVPNKQPMIDYLNSLSIKPDADTINQNKAFHTGRYQP